MCKQVEQERKLVQSQLGFQNENRQSKSSETISKSVLSAYGSDYESANAISESSKDNQLLEGSINTACEAVVNIAENPLTMAGQAGDEYEREWRKALDDMKKGIEDDITKVKTDLNAEIDILRTEKNKVAQDSNTMRTELKTTQLQLNEVIGTVIRQRHEIDECKDKIEMLQEKLDQDVLKITGLVETKDENCVERVKRFFKNILKIEKEIGIRDAYRLGKKETGRDQVMWIRLANH